MPKTVPKIVPEPVVGIGHQSNSPELPPIVALGADEQLHTLMAMGMQAGTERYSMGEVHILLSPPSNEQRMGWHMTISCTDRYPTWDELAKAWYELVPDADHRVGIMILPQKINYISIHPFCFQIHEQIRAERDYQDEIGLLKFHLSQLRNQTRGSD